MNIENKTGEEIEKIVQQKSDEILETLKGYNYKIVKRILDTIKIKSQWKAIL